MKNFNYYMGFVAIFALLLTSCSKEETSATMDDPSSNLSTVLSFRSVLNDLSGRSHFDQVPTCSPEDPAYVVLEISYEGQAPATMGPIEVEILSDEEGLFTAYSELLKVPVSNNGSVMVTLESFQVFDSGDNLIWIAPIENVDGEFDGYVDNPLPFDFEINDGTKPYIDVEVLCFDRRMVNEYGYPFFDIFPGKIYPLCFFANYCTDSGRHYVGNYSVDLYYYDGVSTVQLYSSDDTMPDLNDDNYSADPLCLVVPESPFEDANEPYLYYVITPENWPGYYGDVSDATPLPAVWLNWNDVEGYLNDDGETNEYIHLFINCDDNPGGGDCTGEIIPGVDSDGDCIPDGDDGCPNQAGPIENNGCPLGDDCITDTDEDGVPDCRDLCDNPGETNVDEDGCPIPDDEGEGDCETAFMFGDHEINMIDGVQRWGWVEEFADGQAETTLNIYSGAAYNDWENKGTLVGSATISVDGEGDIHLSITMDPGYTLDELHVNISDISPESEAKSPGQYNMNSDVDAGTTTYEFTDVDYSGNFWIIVHTVTCGLDAED